MQAVLEALTSTTLNVLHVVALAALAVIGIAVWRRVHVKLPGGIQIGEDDSDDVATLRVILEEQRAGYDHLAGRVQTLETRVADLEAQLVAARSREAALEQELAEERATAGARIAQLEAALAAAQERIAALEAELAAALART
jgi:predicted RNase H-like nuclease (RuvC/YqgF family)